MVWVPLPLPQKKRQHWNLASKLPLSGQNRIIFHQPPRFPEKQGGFPFQKATIWVFSVVFSVAMKFDQIYHHQTVSDQNKKNTQHSHLSCTKFKPNTPLKTKGKNSWKMIYNWKFDPPSFLWDMRINIITRWAPSRWLEMEWTHKWPKTNRFHWGDITLLTAVVTYNIYNTVYDW